jgi:ferredoxin-type protein NapH
MSKALSRLRRPTQLFGFLLANLYLAVLFRKQIYAGPGKSICIPFLYCHACPTAAFSCPIGAVQHYAAIHQFPFFLIGHLSLLGLLVGRMACGWLCPFGYLQELLYRVKSRKMEIPRVFSALPYLILIVLVILLPFFTTEHWFSKVCPVGTLVAGIPWVTWNPVNPQTGTLTIEAGTIGPLFVLKIAILVGLLALFVVARRPFCRFMCPLGLFWSFFNRVSFVRLSVGPGCTQCDMCADKCPSGLRVYENPNSPDCVRCLQCTTCKHVECSAQDSREKKPSRQAIDQLASEHE